MSAIAGIWCTDGRPQAAIGLERMLAALVKYGPDSQAHADRGDIALGRCQMKLLPEDDYDRQPLVRADAKIWMVADVRLDNRDELIRKLGLNANIAQSSADSELLIAAWVRWGSDCLQHLVGAFCFAVWDANAQRLFLARDHVGYRPLFFHRSAHCFAFASMPKGLLALPSIPAALDEQQLALQLALVPLAADRTLFAGIHRLLPGHCAFIERAGMRVIRYWDPAAVPEIRLPSDEQYVDAFRERLDAAVHAQLRSTTPIASHLSGGLDSSSVATTAARLLAGQSRELVAMTSVPHPGFAGQISGKFGDEGPAAAAVAVMYPNIRHVLINGGDQRFMDIIDKNSLLDDGPVFNPTNSMWINAIRDEVRARGIQVLLVGQFGNGTISYSGMVALSEWFRRGQWQTLATVGRAMTRNGYASARTVIAYAFRPSLPRRVQKLFARDASLDFSLVHPELVRSMRLDQLVNAKLLTQPRDSRALAQTLFQRNEVGAARAGARAGWTIDERDPTRDRRIVEFCCGIPAGQFLAGGRTRSLVRRAMQGRLPELTLARRDTGMQSADWHLSVAAEQAGMRTELTHLEASPMAGRCLDLPRMRHLIEQWPTSGFANPKVFAPWHYALTRGLAVGHFIRRFDPDAQRGIQT